MEEAPGEGSCFVEESEGGFGATGIDGASLDEELEMGVDFLRGAIGDAPVVHPVSAGTSVAL